MKNLRFDRRALLLIGAVGCAGSPSPDDVSARGGTPDPSSSSGSMSPSAGSASGGNAIGGSAGAAAGVAGSGGSTSTQGGTAGSGQADAGSTSAGTGGLASGGGTGGGGAGGTDPALLAPVTLHLAGDSTVMTYAADSAQEGWGQELPQFLLAKVTIDNQALGGSSVKTFYTGRWQNIIKGLHAGDYVAAAFGANDSGSVDGRHVDPPDFQATFAKMNDEVRAKQASFIAVTPSALQEWNGGIEGNQRLGPYVTALRSFAETSNVKLVDLNARSVEFLNQIGQEAAKQIYIGGDKAHFTKQGATQMAKFVAQELKRIGGPLGDYVK